MGGDDEQEETQSPGGDPAGDVTARGHGEVADGTGEEDLESISWYVYQLRRRGVPFTDIPDRVMADYGVYLSRNDVEGLHRRAMASLPMAMTPEERSKARALEMERLDALQDAAWDGAMQGNRTDIQSVLDVIKMRAQIFEFDAHDGTDPASQLNVLIVGEDKQAFINALSQGRESRQIMAGRDEDDEHGDEEA